jgi:tetratricopeptide (TPR) repeat protein
MDPRRAAVLSLERLIRRPRALLALLLAATWPAAAADPRPALPSTERELAELPPDVQEQARRYLALQREVEDALDGEDWAYAERLGAELERSPVATARAALLRARALLGLGRVAEAADAARRSLASLETAEARSSLAAALHAQEDLEGAEREARRAVELDRMNATLRWQHALLLADLGRYDEAARVGREVTGDDVSSRRAVQVAKWSAAARARPARPRR